MENFSYNQYEKKLTIINTENIDILWMNNKRRGDKNAICLHFLPCVLSAENMHF